MYKYSKVKEGLIKGNFYTDDNVNFLYKKGNLLYTDLQFNFETQNLSKLEVHNKNNNSLKELSDDLNKKRENCDNSISLTHSLIKNISEEYLKQDSNMTFFFGNNKWVEITNKVIWRTIEKLLLGIEKEETIMISYYNKNHKCLLFLTTKYFIISLHLEEGQIYDL